MSLRKCPHCNGKYAAKLSKPYWKGFIDTDNHISFGLSRREPVNICTLCTKTEALADMTGTLTDEMARVAVGQDHQEALRLPKGMYFGMWGFATGGLDEYCDQWEKVYADEAKELENVE
ncbi:hypothetical protein LCGC14_2243630 [marine sediment metagenome]|uniref:Uncharacterized protein n=1 Tax=marine sediment metagenome TaxID=412755 RepID=A0A0F9D4E1_9ZZZZ